MNSRFTGLKCKEVVNIADGCRLGCVCDVEVDCKCGKILSLIVPCPGRGFGLLGRHEEYVIPWCDIRRIGDDIILVDGDLERCRLPKAKHDLF